MQNFKNFLIAYITGLVVFGVLGLLVTGFISRIL